MTRAEKANVKENEYAKELFRNWIKIESNCYKNNWAKDVYVYIYFMNEFFNFEFS